MQKHRDLTLDRLTQFANDELEPRVYPATAPVDLAVYATQDRLPYATAVAAEYAPAAVGYRIEPAWSTHWFRVHVEVPGDWAGKEVHLLWNNQGEACIWRNGDPVHSFAAHQDHVFRREYALLTPAAGGDVLDFHVEAVCNHLFGRLDGAILKEARIAVFDRLAWDLYWDFEIVAGMARHLPATTPRAGQALAAANRIVNLYDAGDRDTWTAARAVAAEFLGQHNGEGQHELSAIGHAHLDTAWLWPLAETMRKCYRTFANALGYMDEYPFYRFACPQARQWSWMKEQQPALYERMRQAAAADRFIPVGGTWVEPDCNVPDGESLVRQFLYGQRFFERELGRRCREFWNPDVFGYCAQLPQIMRGAGITRFLTQKLSWNQFNKLPAHTFIWEGIDGSEVLTHFPPADTYNGSAEVQQLLFNVSNYKDHERGRESYLLFGYGDGGGGPSRSQLERLKRVGDVDGLPRTTVRTANDFFARLETDLTDPVRWVGELYFELHRGTYTTQARTKLGNRRGEQLLQQLELLGAVGPAEFPVAAVDDLWQTLLTNQFHDILPGSSIRLVYEDAEADYARIQAAGGAVRDTLLAAAVGAGDTVLAVNTLAQVRREVVDLPTGDLALVEAPSMGWAPAEPVAPAAPVTVTEDAETITLANGQLRAVLGRDGRLLSLVHLATGRETLARPGNVLTLYDDRPLRWEAWDVDCFHLEKRTDLDPAVEATVVEADPLRASVRFVFNCGAASRVEQTVRLAADSPVLEFASEVDWEERKKFLKVEFPIAVHAVRATYEIQFGHLERPTHFNTSWDMARFEVCAQRWGDLSETGFGVALLNDCKYGYACHGNVLRLSLLRGTSHPDPEADRGHHTFRYGLMPHAGAPQTAGVVAAAAAFNVPLLLTRGAAATRECFAVGNANVVLSTVKPAADGDGVILRLYEAAGSHCRANVRTDLPVGSACFCNLLEDDGETLAWVAAGAGADFAPFQIRTIRLRP